ncbi:MAG: hypothetical protein A7316_02270 [Candidatus Altiarchaeales archaeon WOR_SM1_86-2]|nr:MAG: hypothetical protein A7316_02270 [Candidatus Altiarchaeales archaeon WOR_SM1_86-2]
MRRTEIKNNLLKCGRASLGHARDREFRVLLPLVPAGVLPELVFIFKNNNKMTMNLRKMIIYPNVSPQ